jgi:hypothetical protein
MRKLTALLLIVTLLVAVLPMTGLAAPTAAGGYGHSGKFLAPIDAPDPSAIPIYTAADLDNVRNNLSGSYVLMNDIDLLTWGEWEPIGYEYYGYDSPFTGTFDGQGYEIKNLTITSGTYGYEFVGLFGYAYEANIKNLGLDGTNINIPSDSFEYGYTVGGICGYFEGIIGDFYDDFNNVSNVNACISNCYNTGDIFSEGYDGYGITGGICGMSYYAIVSDCYNSGNITSVVGFTTGGICGESFSFIFNCNNSGNISGIGIYGAGGICGVGAGYGDIIFIFDCYNSGDISGGSSAGGICAATWSSISSCYNIGNISGYDFVGGISGQIAYALFTNISFCYNTGNIALSDSNNWEASAGGICGQFTSDGSISQCYNTGNISASSLYGVFAGGISGSGQCLADTSNCFNTGDVFASALDGDAFAGGIRGENNHSISNCYSTGSITSTTDYEYAYAYAGGIQGGYISNCVVLCGSINAANTANPGSIFSNLVGHDDIYGTNKAGNKALNYIPGNAIDDSDGRINSTQAQAQATYEGLGWDFEGVWKMVPGFDYPQLRWDVLTIAAGNAEFDPDDPEIIVPISFKASKGSFITNGISFTVNYDSAKLAYSRYEFVLPSAGFVYVVPSSGAITISIVSPGVDLGSLDDFKLVFNLAGGHKPVSDDVTDIEISFGSGQGLVLPGGISRENVRLIDGSVIFYNLLLGDINGDRIITLEDADLLMQMVVGVIPFTQRANLVGDVNGDGVIDLIDVVLIMGWA